MSGGLLSGVGVAVRLAGEVRWSVVVCL